MTDLKESLKCANDEARAYLDEVHRLRDENKQFRLQVESHERMRSVFLTMLGVK
jgi:CHAD domain-containing protein